MSQFFRYDPQINHTFYGRIELDAILITSGYDLKGRFINFFMEGKGDLEATLGLF